MSKLLIIGHRGARNIAPENSLEAINAALEMGLRAVEFDVSVSRDGTPIVIHQSTLTPNFKRKKIEIPVVARSKNWTWKANYKELADLDAGSWFMREFKNVRIPKLAEVLTLPWKNATAVMEIKVPACRYKLSVNCSKREQEEVSSLSESIIPITQEFVTSDRHKLWVLSFSVHLLRTWKKRMRQIPQILAIEDRVGTIGQALKVARDLDLLAFTLSDKRVIREPIWVKAAQDAGFKVFVYESTPATKLRLKSWNAKSREKIWKKLIDLGVDGITTDFPQELRRFELGSK